MDHAEDLSKTEELVMGLSNTNVVNDAKHVIKGKRTKRLRLLSTTTVITSSCSSASGGGGDDQGSLSISSKTTDQEEEDMANCLILLAQGGGGSGSGAGDYSDHDQQQHQQQHQKQQVDQDKDHGDHHTIEIKGRKLSELGTAYGAATTNKVGFYIYECKTCNRTFPSFQALGGHRASHKRPKIMAEEKKPPLQAPPPPPVPSSPPSSRPQVVDTNYDHHQFESGGDRRQLQPHMKRFHPVNPISLQFGSAQKANNSIGNNNIKTKIHECSICGSEFTSGQALGGHMRRHRASTNSGAPAMSGTETISNATATACTATVAFEVQPRTILELDLNLPAPEEELRDLPKFQFTATTQKSIVLSAAPALVDCHY